MEYKIGNEARCAVIGYGSWATAIVGLLTANETRVGWYVRNPEVLEGLLTEGRNPRYLSDMEFDPSVCRNIAVDIRYVLFVIDRIGGASYLLQEMEIR